MGKKKGKKGKKGLASLDFKLPLPQVSIDEQFLALQRRIFGEDVAEVVSSLDVAITVPVSIINYREQLQRELIQRYGTNTKPVIIQIARNVLNQETTVDEMADSVHDATLRIALIDRAYRQACVYFDRQYR